MAPDVLTKGIYRKTLEAPSHVVLNHANCWTVKNPTLAPSSSSHAAGSFTSTKTGEDISESDKSLTAVSLTMRVNPNSNKFATMTYYKPVTMHN